MAKKRIPSQHGGFPADPTATAPWRLLFGRGFTTQPNGEDCQVSNDLELAEERFRRLAESNESSFVRLDVNVDMRSVGRQIQSVRKLMKLTQADLASRCGLSAQQVGRAERDPMETKVKHIVTLCDALGVDASVSLSSVDQK